MIDKTYNKFNKIKVCHFVSGLKAGGVESMIYNYCSKLNKNKYEFHLVYQHEPSQKNVDEFTKIGFKLHRIPYKVKHPLKNYIESKKYLKNNNIDVVHCHMTLMNFIPLLAAKKLDIKKRICHSHNCDVREKNVIIKLIEKILKKINIMLSTDLLACGEDAGKYLYSNKKFVVLKNALDLDKFKFNNEVRKKIRNFYNIENNEILVGHIGRFTNQKNHEFIISIADKLINNEKNKKIKFILIGDGNNKQSIEQSIVEKKLEKSVLLTGVVDNTNEFYSSFDCFILPSLWEGLPVVGIEAQVSKLQCFFSNKIDKNVKIEKNVEFIDIDNINEWCNKIKQIQFYERNSDLSKFKSNGLDIKTEIYKLDNIYSGGLE